MASAFPYPEQGDVTRPPGQGCLSCIHRTYCPVIYWYRRNEGNVIDDYMGRRCSSWSDNPTDKVTEPSQDDLDENDYLNDQYLLVENELWFGGGR